MAPIGSPFQSWVQNFDGCQGVCPGLLNRAFGAGVCSGTREAGTSSLKGRTNLCPQSNPLGHGSGTPEP